MAVLDKFTLNTGFVSPYGTYHGFRTNQAQTGVDSPASNIPSRTISPTGAINDSSSPYEISSSWYDNSFISKLERGSDPGFIGVRLQLRRNDMGSGSPFDNSSWWDLRKADGSSIFRRVDASYTPTSDAYANIGEWTWTTAGNFNPFTQGVDYDIEITDNGVGSEYSILPNTSQAIGLGDLGEYLGVSGTISLGGTTVRDYLGVALGVSTSLGDYRFEGKYLNPGTTATTTDKTAINSVSVSDTSPTFGFVGVNVGYKVLLTRISDFAYVLQVRDSGYTVPSSSTSTDSIIKNVYNLGNKPATLTTGYEQVFLIETQDAYNSIGFFTNSFSTIAPVGTTNASTSASNSDATYTGSNYGLYNISVGQSIGFEVKISSIADSTVSLSHRDLNFEVKVRGTNSSTNAIDIFPFSATLRLEAEAEYVGGGGGTGSGTTGSITPVFTLAGRQDTWQTQNINMNPFIGETGRLVLYYESGSNYSSDVQIDNYLTNGGFQEMFTSSNAQWETTTGDMNTIESTLDYDTYAGYSFSPITTNTTTSTMWHRRSGGTPSGTTGVGTDGSGSTTGYYLYAETSGPSNVSIWARSPEIAVTNGTWWLRTARLGTAIGTLRGYWVVEGEAGAGADPDPDPPGGSGGSNDLTSSFVPLPARFIDSAAAMGGSNADYTGGYDVSELVTDFSGNGRIYIAHKVTASVTYFSDVPIGFVQLLDSNNNVKQAYRFNSTLGWTTTNTNIVESGVGISETPSNVSQRPFVSIATTTNINTFSLASSTGSSFTGAADGVVSTTGPLPLGQATMLQQAGTNYLFRETSGTVIDQVAYMRSPIISIAPGDKIRVAHAITGSASSQQDPTDTLFVAVI